MKKAARDTKKEKKEITQLNSEEVRMTSAQWHPDHLVQEQMMKKPILNQNIITM